MPNMRLSAKTWAATVCVLVIYFAYILTIGFAPDLFGRPISDGLLTSWGLVLGALIMVVCMVAALFYTTVKNRADAARPDTVARP